MSLFTFPQPTQRTEFIDSPYQDAFSRSRVSTTSNIFRDSWVYSKSSPLWEEILSGTGVITHLAPEPQIQLSTGGTASGASAKRQTHTYFMYFPGNSQLINMSFCFTSNGDTNVTRRIGYYDNSNGAFLELANSTKNVVIRSFVSGSVVENRIAQSSWNMDKLDGTGPSGITLDLTKQQILLIDFQWLGAGRVRFGFDFGGNIVYCHQFNHANVIATTYSQRGALPLAIEILNTGVASAAKQVKYSCVSLLTEGFPETLQEIPFSASNGSSLVTVSARRPVLSIRCKTTFNSQTFRGHLHPVIASAFATGNSGFFELVYNGTLTGASFADVDTTNSAAQFDTAATAISGGIILQSGFVPVGFKSDASTAAGLSGPLVVTNNAAGTTSDILSIVCTPIGGPLTTTSSLGWIEHQH